MKRISMFIVVAVVGMVLISQSEVFSQQQFPMDAQAGYAFKKKPGLPSVSRGLPSGQRMGPQGITKCLPPMPSPCPSPMPFCPLPPFPQPCNSAGIEPSVYLGYLYKDHGAGYKLQVNNGAGTGLGITSMRNDFDLQGIWLELAFPVTISKELTGRLSGAHLFSLQPKSTQSYTIAASPSAARWWNPEVFWWEVDGSGAYRLGQYLSVVAGFRWTSLGGDFGNAYDERGFVVPNADSNTLRTNTYIPYSGIMIENRNDCQGGLKIAGYGSPVVPADFSVRETMSLNAGSITLNPQVNIGAGYFVEGYSEYWMKRESLTFGGFAKFTAVHCERTVGLQFGTVNIPIDVSFDRKNWIFGGKIGYVF